jgi:hypothetical protein
MFFEVELFVEQQRREVMSKFVKFGLAFEPVVVDKANDIELQYPKIGLNESGVGQDNIEVLFLDVGKEQVIQNVELVFLF